jgi:hypothetical protein
MAENEWGHWEVDPRWEDPSIDLNAILYEDVSKKMKAAIRASGISIEGGAGEARVPNPEVPVPAKVGPPASEESIDLEMKRRETQRQEANVKYARKREELREDRHVVRNERSGEVPNPESRIGGRK